MSRPVDPHYRMQDIRAGMDSSDTDKSQQSPEQKRLQAVQQLGQPSLPPKMEGGIHVLSVIGQIEGHVLLPPKNKTTKYEHVIPQLVAVEQNPSVKGLLILLNTVGGDIEAGLAIAEMIRTLSKPTVSLVLGGGHSIGAPIAVAARRSFIAGTATMTVHPIRLTGLVIGVPQTYEYLDKMQDRVIKFIIENTSIDERSLRELMFRTGELMRDVGTVLVGPEAVQASLIDEVGGLAEATLALRQMIERESGEASQPVQEAEPVQAPPPVRPVQPAAQPEPGPRRPEFPQGPGIAPAPGVPSPNPGWPPAPPFPAPQPAAPPPVPPAPMPGWQHQSQFWKGRPL